MRSRFTNTEKRTKVHPRSSWLRSPSPPLPATPERRGGGRARGERRGTGIDRLHLGARGCARFSNAAVSGLPFPSPSSPPGRGGVQEAAVSVVASWPKRSSSPSPRPRNRSSRARRSRLITEAGSRRFRYLCYFCYLAFPSVRRRSMRYSNNRGDAEMFDVF